MDARSSRTIVIFPGQGIDFARPDVGAVLGARQGEVSLSGEILGYSISELLTAQDSRLVDTEFVQPAIFVINALRYILSAKGQDGQTPDVVAGHSVGEYNALVAAGVLTFEDALRLVHRRAQAMATVSPMVEDVPEFGMVAILGLPSNDVVRLVGSTDQFAQVDVANYNSPSQTVVAGHEKSSRNSVSELSLRVPNLLRSCVLAERSIRGTWLPRGQNWTRYSQTRASALRRAMSYRT